MNISRALAVGGVLAVGGLGGAIVASDHSSNGTTTPTSTQGKRITAAATTPSSATSAREIYDHSIDSIAYIESVLPQGQASGSGFVVDASGLIVTNAHVVDGAQQVTVKLGAKGTTQPAQVLAADTSRDLALLKVEGANLPALELEQSATPGVGDATYAIGSPYGLQQSLTTGIVSALDRDIQAPDGTVISGVIQTDAAINPGNSGGPLIDAEGRVIGVNSQIASKTGGNVGIGFAIPAGTVRQFLEDVGNGQTGSAQSQAPSQDQQQGAPEQQPVDPYGGQQQADPYADPSGGQQASPYGDPGGTQAPDPYATSELSARH